jgi:adenylate cyclase
MEDLTQSQVRTLEDEAALLKQSLQALIPKVESGRTILETLRLPPEQRAPLSDTTRRAETLLKQAYVLIERMEPAMRALRQDINHTRRERNQLSSLYEISQVLNSTLSLQPLLDMIMDRVIAVTRAERGFLTLVDEQTGEQNVAVARNMDRQDVEAQSFQVSRGIIDRVAREGTPLLTDNASADPRFADRASVIYFGLRSIMAVPLRVKERVIGVVYVDNRIQAGIFSQEDLDLLTAFANQAAIAMENARLFDDLQRSLNEITEIKLYMEDIFASVDSGIITTDLETVVTTCNRAAADIFGVSETEATGRRFLELFEERQRHELGAPLNTALEKETRLRDYELTCTLPQRGYVTLKLQITPLKDAQDNKIGVTLVVEDLTEERRLHQTLNRYLSPLVAQEALRMAATGQHPLGGTRRVMSLLFADVRGFTSFSERVAPETLVDILNRHLTVAARAILEHGGTLDKFMGDAVMALFNVPVPQPDHALRAVRAALEMQHRIAALEETGGHCFRFGVGIHVGEAVAGNIGSPERLDYTAIGDAVNISKRLQENAEGGQILLSGAAYQEVAPYVEVRSLGALTVKGREEPVEVYVLLGLRASPQEG